MKWAAVALLALFCTSAYGAIDDVDGDDEPEEKDDHTVRWTAKRHGVLPTGALLAGPRRAWATWGRSTTFPHA